MKRTLDNINKEFLVDLLSTATYGCDFLSLHTLVNENTIDDQFDEGYLRYRCREERWADRLLGGGHVVVLDWEDTDVDDKPTRHELTLEDFKNGLIKARDGEAAKDWADFVDETDDFYTCNNLLQVIVFGEIVYG